MTLELTRKSTWLIELAVTDAVILTVDLRATVELFAGLVMETTGDAGPLTIPATVMVIDADVDEFPALSVATA
jgi:hypothetical protein